MSGREIVVTSQDLMTGTDGTTRLPACSTVKTDCPRMTLVASPLKLSIIASNDIGRVPPIGLCCDVWVRRGEVVIANEDRSIFAH